MEIFTVILFYIAMWLGVSFFSNIILHFLNVYDKICLQYYRPISKKFQTKVSPVYEMTKEYDEFKRENDYLVTKWELGYETNMELSILMKFLLPYPVEIQSYRYIQGETYIACKEYELETFSKKYSLEEFYEKKYEEEHKEVKAEEEKRNRTNEILKRMNKTFLENYQK